LLLAAQPVDEHGLGRKREDLEQHAGGPRQAGRPGRVSGIFGQPPRDQVLVVDIVAQLAVVLEPELTVPGHKRVVCGACKAALHPGLHARREIAQRGAYGRQFIGAQ